MRSSRRGGTTACREQSESIRRQFTSKEFDLWAYANGITLDFSRPGKPTDNAYAESFNATVRLECLGRFWFLDLNDARENQRSETS